MYKKQDEYNEELKYQLTASINTQIQRFNALESSIKRDAKQQKRKGIAIGSSLGIVTIANIRIVNFSNHKIMKRIKFLLQLIDGLWSVPLGFFIFFGSGLSLYLIFVYLQAPNHRDGLQSNYLLVELHHYRLNCLCKLQQYTLS